MTSLREEREAPASKDARSIVHEQAQFNEVVTVSAGPVGAGGPSLANRVDALLHNDRLLEAARLIRRSPEAVAIDLSEEHVERFFEPIVAAEKMEALISSLIAEPGGHGWLTQCEHSGVRNVSIYYKYDDETQTRCTLRIQSPIERSLFVPLLAVLNESQLYKTWLPSWTIPQLCCRRSEKLQQIGRCSQVILVTCDVPWPLYTREGVCRATGIDDIDETGHVAVYVESLQPDMDQGGCVPDIDDPYIVRCDFAGGFLFRLCPGGYPNGECANESKPMEGDNADGGGEGCKMLVAVQGYIDPKLTSLVPATLSDFMTRTVLDTMWCQLIQVAEDIRDGERPDYAIAIAEKRELYDWFESRAQDREKNMGWHVLSAPRATPEDGV